MCGVKPLTRLAHSVYSHCTVSLWATTPSIPSTKSISWPRARGTETGRGQLGGQGGGEDKDPGDSMALTSKDVALVVVVSSSTHTNEATQPL